MSVEQLDSDQTIPLTPVSSFGPPNMAGVEMPVPTGQPVVIHWVSTQGATNIIVNINNPLINGTNQVASGHPLTISGCASNWRGRLAAIWGQPKQSVGQSH